MKENMKKCSFGIELGEINFCFQGSLQQPAFLIVLCGSRGSGGLGIYYILLCFGKKINKFHVFASVKGMITTLLRVEPCFSGELATCNDQMFKLSL